MIARLVATLMRHELRRTFRRVGWVGDAPALPDAPVVLYANHHHFYDGHLLWLLTRRLLDRPGLTWMADWDRFPFFAAAGALPFPPNDPARRRTTLRRTVRHFHAQPDAVLVYFPEGTLHAPEDGIRPFPPHAFERLARLLPEAWWWPVAVHVTWWGDARPTALLTGGAPHATPDGNEQRRLEHLWQTLRRERPASVQMLLEGRGSPSDIWDFSFARRFFERYLPPHT